MRKQVTRISIHQSSKVISLMFFIMIAIFFIPFSIVSYILTGNTESLAFLLAPFAYLILTYIMYVIFFWFYNMVASAFGGVEFELNDIE